MVDRPCVIAFDLDNTLHDPDMRAYRAAVDGLLDACDLGLPRDDASEAFEAVRATGDALERLGLRNAIHDRANPDGLAVLLLTRCQDAGIRAELMIGTERQASARLVVDELARLHRDAWTGTPDDRLAAECRVRRLCATDPRVASLRDEVVRLSRHALVRGWSEVYRELEGAQATRDHRPLVRQLEARGLTPIVISEGRSAVQREKLRRLGLDRPLDGRILITEDAAGLPGLPELDGAVDQGISDVLREGAAGSGSRALRRWWHFRCVLDEWARKSPGFYARCLHAIHLRPDRPEGAIVPPAFVPADDWRDRPLRFVMIGDRYEKDVAPVQRLLGREAGMTLHLRSLKYGRRVVAERGMDDFAPTRSFDDWDAVAAFLTDEFEPASVGAIARPPGYGRSTLSTAEIAWGLESSLEAVRAVARWAADSESGGRGERL